MLHYILYGGESRHLKEHIVRPSRFYKHKFNNLSVLMNYPGGGAKYVIQIEKVVPVRVIALHEENVRQDLTLLVYRPR